MAYKLQSDRALEIITELMVRHLRFKHKSGMRKVSHAA